jgi:hypothetical protein
VSTTFCSLTWCIGWVPCSWTQACLLKDAMNIQRLTQKIYVQKLLTRGKKQGLLSGFALMKCHQCRGSVALCSQWNSRSISSFCECHYVSFLNALNTHHWDTKNPHTIHEVPFHDQDVRMVAEEPNLYLCYTVSLWRQSDSNGTGVCMSPAYIGTSGRGEVAAPVSLFSVHVPKLCKQKEWIRTRFIAGKWAFADRTFSVERKCLYGATNLKVAEWHWMRIQRNTEADPGPRTLMRIVSLSKVWFIPIKLQDNMFTFIYILRSYSYIH